VNIYQPFSKSYIHIFEFALFAVPVVVSYALPAGVYTATAIKFPRRQAQEGSFLQCIALRFEIAEGGADEYSKGSRWLY